MKSLTTTSKISLGGGLIVLLASVSLTACSSNSSAQGSDQSRLAMQSNQQCADYLDCRDQDGFLAENPDGRGMSPGVNFGRWMAGGSN
jgi:hypothetical protein